MLHWPMSSQLHSNFGDECRDARLGKKNSGNRVKTNVVAAHASAEFYDPASNAWTAAGALATARAEHTATLLPNGKVLVAGGYLNDPLHTVLASAELYDPATNIWTVAGSLAVARRYHSATLLPDGTVLAAGGSELGTANGDFYLNHAFSSAELFNPATNTWTKTASLTTARSIHTATLLSNRKVLVTGGFNRLGGTASPDTAFSTTELYQQATNP